MKISQTNRGKALEGYLEWANMLYANQGIALVRKVEVPRIWDKKSGTMKYAARTGFDYEGLICSSGRYVAVEAKETQANGLYVDPTGKRGLRAHQVAAVIQYGHANAYAGVVWSCLSEGKIFFLDWKFLEDWMATVYNKEMHRGKPVKSIKLRHVEPFCPDVLRNGVPDYLMML
jgi:penicillin-binding protein-related factor A (putative recombinase)